MGYAGQKCTATGRVIVVGDAAPFTDALVAAVEALPTGDPADADTVVGPVINATGARRGRRRARRRSAATAASSSRAVEKLDGPGLFVTPAIVAGQSPDARLAQEEVFGPIATVLRADSAEQAVEISNRVPVRPGHVGVHERPDVRPDRGRRPGDRA